MPFIGNQPAESYSAFQKQDFTTSATTSYTLDNPVANANELALFINFVRQEPTTAYTASGTTLTLTSATASSDDMYCVFLGKAVQTVNPPNASVGISQLSATGTKDATTFLRGDNTFAVAGGTNTPAFEAYRSDNQGISDGVWTKVQFDIEEFDTNSMYDNSTNYRFTPTTSGKYLCYYVVRGGNDGGSTLNNVSVKFYKNGSTYQTASSITTNFYNNPGANATQSSTQIINFNGSSDYLEVFCYIDTTANSPDVGQNSVFGAYKIIE